LVQVDGLDWDELAADIATEASVALELCEQIAKLETRIHDLYLEVGPEGTVLSAPGVGKILAAQILGRLGDPHRFTSLAAARSFSGLVPDVTPQGCPTPVPGPASKATPVFPKRCTWPRTTLERPTRPSRRDTSG
jgi:hypothetical protein